jgi:hypothetical protein
VHTVNFSRARAEQETVESLISEMHTDLIGALAAAGTTRVRIALRSGELRVQAVQILNRAIPITKRSRRRR